MKHRLYGKWGLLWQSKKKSEQFLMFNGGNLLMFNTRKQARKFANDNYGYIKTRKDLRTNPHNWRMPLPVRLINVSYAKK